MNVLSIDIGGTSFRIGAVRADGSLIRFDKVPTASVFCTENVLHDLAAYIKVFTWDIHPEAYYFAWFRVCGEIIDPADLTMDIAHLRRAIL